MTAIKMGFPWRSIPRDDLQTWFLADWAYVMPDFDRPGFYIVEWRSDTTPVEPNRVSKTKSEGDEHGPTGAGT